MATTYEKIKLNQHKVQVDSAIRDGDGKIIKDTYAKKTDVPTAVSQLENDENFIGKEWATDNLQEKLTPGSGITIEGNVISATGGGGGSGAIYKHHIRFYSYTGSMVTIEWINGRSTPYDRCEDGDPDYEELKVEIATATHNGYYPALYDDGYGEPWCPTSIWAHPYATIMVFDEREGGLIDINYIDSDTVTTLQSSNAIYRHHISMDSGDFPVTFEWYNNRSTPYTQADRSELIAELYAALNGGRHQALGDDGYGESWCPTSIAVPNDHYIAFFDWYGGDRDLEDIISDTVTEIGG